MPIYEYDCGEHGPFELLRPMSQSSAPAPCPVCDGAARRIISAPNLSGLPRHTVKALDRNEKSRHEPTVVRREAKQQSSEPPRARAHVGSRPWCLEHG